VVAAKVVAQFVRRHLLRVVAPRSDALAEIADAGHPPPKFAGTQLKALR
jgi:hypothetical protein